MTHGNLDVSCYWYKEMFVTPAIPGSFPGSGWDHFLYQIQLLGDFH